MGKDRRKEKRKREKEKKEEEKEGPKSNGFGAFLKKRAPIYLGLVGLFLVFAVPELTKGDLESSFPELAAKDQQIVDVLMGYNGPNKVGLTVMEALSNRIAEEYPDERIYDNRETSVDLSVSEIGSGVYQVTFDFKSHKGEMNYNWNVNSDSNDIEANNPDSKYILDVVDFYD